MAAIQVYQGTNPSVSLNLYNPDGTPYNATGAVLYFTAKQDYAADSYMFNIGVTGTGAVNGPRAATGLFVFPMTTGDTSFCAGVYPAQFTLVSGSNISKVPPTDIEIQAAVLTL